MSVLITDLDNEKARRFLLDSNSYCDISLPCYFNFRPLLDKLANCSDIPRILRKKTYTSHFANREQDAVNYLLYTNKDGKLAWRPLQLINPVAYVYLVNILTEKNTWEYITQRFAKFQANKNIICCSLPLVKGTKNVTSETIVGWYEKFEKQAIKKSLDYRCMLTTDILNCYGSIYTHSIAWALHPMGKTGAKNDKNDHTKIFNAVDKIIQDISYGQTNGIPQGSILMDFIAEIVLGYADLLLSEKIASDKSIGDNSYCILRYRDDYKIFTKNKIEAEKIAKYLCEVLIGLNLKLNENKTGVTENIITDVQKSDKLYWRGIQEGRGFGARILQIHSLSEKYPNSGAVLKALAHFYDDIEAGGMVNTDLELIASVVTDIAYNNPRTYHYTISILGKIGVLMNEKDKQALFDRIMEKFSSVLNSEYLNIWLQRLSKQSSLEGLGSGRLCDYVREYTSSRLNDLGKIWDFTGCSSSIQKIFEKTPIVSIKKFKSMSEYPKPDEVRVFQKSQY